MGKSYKNVKWVVMYPVIHEVDFVKAHKTTMLAVPLQVYTMPTMVPTCSEGWLLIYIITQIIPQTTVHKGYFILNSQMSPI